MSPTLNPPAVSTDPPNPSLSRTPPPSAQLPPLAHTLHQEQTSVLSLAADDNHIFSGSQGQDIYVWDRKTLQVKTTLEGHSGSVLALEIAADKQWLFSSSGDSTVRIWSTSSLAPLFILNPHLDTESGDIFSLTYSSLLNTVYFGCQNTSLQWFDLSKPEQSPPANETAVRRWHKFFDSQPQPAGRPVRTQDGASTPAPPPYHEPSEGPPNPPVKVLQVPPQNVVPFAHFGYIYCMALLPSPQTSSLEENTPTSFGVVQLLTGSGDEDVKLWYCDATGPRYEHTFLGCEGGVLSLIARDGTFYAGCQGGHVKVWDLETRTLVRTIIAQENVDILSLSMLDTDLYTCSANGYVQRWSASFQCTASWQAHAGIVLSSIITRCQASGKEKFSLVTGANDNDIKIWDIGRPNPRDVAFDLSERHCEPASTETMIYALSKFVSIPSVSSSEPHREDCRQAAIWLKKCLSQLGAEAYQLPSQQGVNPLVLGTFQGTQGKHRKPRVLFYGHYDVISAPPDGWETDPFSLTGKNGYLYGRGVTDNKGPILAVACAASELLDRRALELDLVVLVEGEEEAGSVGFEEAVRQHKDLIGHVDAILVSNSYWIGEDVPCITYGLRGVVHCGIELSSQRPDLHSGVEGGAITEPMVDMVKLLATLSDGPKIAIPNFYDHVRPRTSAEDSVYSVLSTVTQKPSSYFASRWREPSLSIHSLEVSGPGNATVIPARVKAKVSIRIVPDQDLESIAKALTQHIRSSFETLQSPNTLEVSIERTADWWLGELDGRWFRALEEAVKDEWGTEPLRIREGGSIPSIPLLEKVFGCRALHLPMGQSSDQAHLHNERISLNNLRRGKAVVERFLVAVGKMEVE